MNLRLILIATLGCLPIAAAASQTRLEPVSPGTNESIVISSDDRWRGSVLRARVDTSQCSTNVIVVSIAFEPGQDGPGWRSRVTEITINGRRVPERQLADVNGRIATFARSPEINPQCFGERFALSLTQVEHSGVSRSELVPFALSDPE